MIVDTHATRTAKISGDPMSPLSRMRAHASDGRLQKRPRVSKSAGRKPRVSRASQGRGATGTGGGAEGGWGGTVDMARPPCLARPRAGACRGPDLVREAYQLRGPVRNRAPDPARNRRAASFHAVIPRSAASPLVIPRSAATRDLPTARREQRGQIPRFARNDSWPEHSPFPVVIPRSAATRDLPRFAGNHESRYLA